jgi:CubicO group peptidase (beta-lactamase class C family)
MRQRSLLLALGLSVLLAADPGPASAQQAPRLPPPEATDPVALGIMAGAPPPANRRVSLANLLAYPNPRWGFHHMRELAPSRAVATAGKPVRSLSSAHASLESVMIDDGTGNRISLADWQKNTYTDGLIVLHNGRVVLEKYHAGMQPGDAHALWSLSKSFVGLLTAMLAHEGKLELQAPVSRYVPELAGTAWGEATIQQTLDMTTAAAYTEVFTDPASEVFKYLIATGLVPAPTNYPGARILYDYLPTVAARGEHGVGFAYKSVDTEVLGWVIRRVTGKDVAALLSERIWSRIGAEQEAYYLLDPTGTAIASIGLNTTLRDLARFGEMMRNGGKVGDAQVVPAGIVATIRRGGDPTKFRAAGQTARDGYSYRNQWWIAHDADGTFEAKGLHGQHIHINPAAGLVIVKLSSHPIGNTIFTHTLDRTAFRALASALRR